MKDYFYESATWSRLRYIALRRDGFKCLACGASRESGSVMHVDHIKPRSKYPALELVLENLQTLCDRCNIGKGAKYEDDFLGKKMTRGLIKPPEYRKTRRYRAFTRLSCFLKNAMISAEEEKNQDRFIKYAHAFLEAQRSLKNIEREYVEGNDNALTSLSDVTKKIIDNQAGITES